VDVANARLESTISIRRGLMFQPKAVFGRPRAMSDVVIGPARAYRGLPEPATRNLDELPPVVNSLLPYWIQHGRIDVVPGIGRLRVVNSLVRYGTRPGRIDVVRGSGRFAGRRVPFVDGTSREFDTILWATGFRARLPFLDAGLIRWHDGVPLRTAGLTLPVGA